MFVNIYCLICVALDGVIMYAVGVFLNEDVYGWGGYYVLIFADHKMF